MVPTPCVASHATIANRSFRNILLVFGTLGAFVGGFASFAQAQAETTPGEGTIRNPVDVIGEAPWPPGFGGRASGATCLHPDMAYHPRCVEWRKAYEEYQEKLKAYLAEHGQSSGR